MIHNTSDQLSRLCRPWCTDWCTYVSYRQNSTLNALVLGLLTLDQSTIPLKEIIISVYTAGSITVSLSQNSLPTISITPYIIRHVHCHCGCVRSIGLLEINSYSVVVQLRVEFPPIMEIQIPLDPMDFTKLLKPHERSVYNNRLGQPILQRFYEGAKPQDKSKGFLKLHTIYCPIEITTYIHLHQLLFSFVCNGRFHQLSVHYLLTFLWWLTSAFALIRRSTTGRCPSWLAIYRGVEPSWR